MPSLHHSKMASTPRCCLPIFFTFLIFIPTIFLINTILQSYMKSIKMQGENSKKKPMFANGDDPLISIVCSNSLPEYCLRRFNSNPQSKQVTDIGGFGNVSIDCDLYQSLALGKHFYSYASNQPEKQIECRIIYDNIWNILIAALDSLTTNLYQDSKLQVRAAQDAHYRCIDLIIGANLPNDLDSSLHHFEAFTSASSDVINHIQSFFLYQLFFSFLQNILTKKAYQHWIKHLYLLLVSLWIECFHFPTSQVVSYDQI